MSWDLVKLGAVAKVKNGYAFKSKEYVNDGSRIIRITNVQKGEIVDNSPQFIDSSRLSEFKSFQLFAEDILISLTGNVGRVGMLKKEHEPALLNQRVGAIKVISKKIYPKYLYLLLNSDKFEKDAIKNSSGAAQLNLSSKWVEEYNIPLPPLNDQIRIAALLSGVETIIATRKDNLRLLDEFLKSTFLEMFGDPVRNEKGWGKKEIGNLLFNIDSGWSPKCFARKAEANEWGVLKLGAVTSCIYDDSENKALPEDVIPKLENEVHVGDLLFSRKNTYELVAACAYVFKTKQHLMMSDLIFRLVIKDKNEINPLYMWKLLIDSRQRRIIQSLAGGAAGSMPNISKQKLKSTFIPVPPIELQNQFAAIVEKVESLKENYQKNLTELENLYGALSQKAFKGALDLSRVPLATNLLKETYESTNSLTAVKHENTRGLTKGMRTTKIKTTQELFDDFISNNSGFFSIDDFWKVVLNQFQNCHDLEDPYLYSPYYLRDYEEVKQWLFDLIKIGKVSQRFNETTNQIELSINP
ncbi:restriction endonuclease subunit S [Methylobacter sp.]